MTTDAQRDPRTQPVAGDVLEIGSMRREVIDADEKFVTFVASAFGRSGSSQRIPHANWSPLWGKDRMRLSHATIIRRGDQP